MHGHCRMPIQRRFRNRKAACPRPHMLRLLFPHDPTNIWSRFNNQKPTGMEHSRLNNHRRHDCHSTCRLALQQGGINRPPVGVTAAAGHISHLRATREQGTSKAHRNTLLSGALQGLITLRPAEEDGQPRRRVRCSVWKWRSIGRTPTTRPAQGGADQGEDSVLRRALRRLGAAESCRKEDIGSF